MTLHGEYVFHIVFHTLENDVFHWNTMEYVEYVWNTRIYIPNHPCIPVEYAYSISFSSYSPCRSWRDPELWQTLRRHAVTAVKVGLAEQCLSCRTSSGQAAELIRMLGQPAAASACPAALPGLRSASAVGERRRPLVRISTFCNRKCPKYSCNVPTGS